MDVSKFILKMSKNLFLRLNVKYGSISFISLHGCSFCLFFFLSFFPLQVPKYHPLGLGSNYEHNVCVGERGRWKPGRRRMTMNELLVLPGLGGEQFYEKVGVISDINLNET
jgi:hypothetical protein